MTEQEILLKHYEIQHTALNEIKELIELRDFRNMTDAETILAVNDVAGYASEVDLTNQIGIEKSRTFIADLPYDPLWDILLQARKETI